MYDVCVYGYVFPNINANCVEEAKYVACNMYTKLTGDPSNISDEHIVWKKSLEYPYEWR